MIKTKLNFKNFFVTDRQCGVCMCRTQVSHLQAHLNKKSIIKGTDAEAAWQKKIQRTGVVSN